MLKIIEDLGVTNKRRYVLVECPDCGKKYRLDKYNALRTEKCKSCKQVELNASRKKYKNSASRKLYNNYKNSAKSRNILFDLSYADFLTIVAQDCHYCDSKPNMVDIVYGDEFIHNGVDRIDSSKGYEVGNVVPCCTICNFGKNDLSYEEFIKYLQKVGEKWG